MEEVVSAKELKKVYWLSAESVVVLKSIDFQIKKEEFVAIVGPSGSGKTTLLKRLAKKCSYEEDISGVGRQEQFSQIGIWEVCLYC